MAALGDVPLIGFAGAPFTLASYLVEGGPSRNHERTKAMMLGEPATWHALMTALTDITIGFLRAQLDAGVDAIQLFDSWAGTLSLADYRSHVLPHSARVFDALAGDGVPMTHFGVGTAELLGAMGEAGRDASSGSTGAPRWPTPPPGWARASRCRATSIRWCCWRAGRWSSARCATSSRTAVAPSPRARRATCSTSATACCPPPIRASSPRPWRWCTRCEQLTYAVVGGRHFGPGRRLPAAPGGRPGRVDHAVRPGRPARRGAAHRARSAASRWTSAPRRSSRGAPRCPRCWPNSGLADRQVGTTGVRPLIYSGGRLHPMPQGTLQGIPAQTPRRSRGWSTTRPWRGCGDERLRPFAWRTGADPSVAEFVGDRFGEQVVARSVDPLLAGVYAGSAATIGVRSAVPTLAAALDRGAPSLTDAVRQALPPPMHRVGVRRRRRRLPVLLDELVRRADFRWAHVAVDRVERADGRGGRWSTTRAPAWHADAVVLAVPAPRLPRMVEGVAPRTAAAARRIGVASTALVVLALPGGTPLPAQSGVLVASGERLARQGDDADVAQVGRPRQRRAGAAVVRHGSATTSRATSATRNCWSGRPRTSRRCSASTSEPVDCHVQRWIDAMPQYGPGHVGLVAELRAGLAAERWPSRAATWTASACPPAWRRAPGRRRR